MSLERPIAIFVRSHYHGESVQAETLQLLEETLSRLGHDLHWSSTAPALQVDSLAHGKTILIDPGHGGADRGHSGEQSGDEADFVLRVAQDLARTLEIVGARACLTRQEDISRSLDERVLLADRLNADLVLSLHTGWHTEGSQRGAAGFYTPFPWLRNRHLAMSILSALTTVTALPERGRFLVYPQRPGHLNLLTHMRVPSLALELGCQASPEDEAVLTSPRLIEYVACGLTAGLLHFWGLTAPADQAARELFRLANPPRELIPAAADLEEVEEQVEEHANEQDPAVPQLEEREPAEEPATVEASEAAELAAPAEEPAPVKVAAFDGRTAEPVEPEPVDTDEPEPIDSVEPEPDDSVDPEPNDSVEPEPDDSVEPEPNDLVEPEDENEEVVLVSDATQPGEPASPFPPLVPTRPAHGRDWSRQIRRGSSNASQRPRGWQPPPRSDRGFE